MGRFGYHFSAAIVALILLFQSAPGPGLAWAGPHEGSANGSNAGIKGPKDEFDWKPTVQLNEDGRGFKGLAVSLEDAGDNKGLHLKTSVLVKPLKTDQFFVAFAAAAPLGNNEGSPPVGDQVAMSLQDRSSGVYAPHFNPDRETASDWLVVTDWPQSSRLLASDRDLRFNWMPEMSGHIGWHSKMELIFLPADQWTIRAILSLAHDPSEYRQLFSMGDESSTRIGMAIDVDYQIFNSIALGFDYGHWRYGRSFNAATGDGDLSPNQTNSDKPLQSDTFTARLTIRF